MKNIFLIIVSFALLVSCKKDNSDPSDQDINTQNELRKIVSDAYLKEAKNLGFVLYEGSRPPQIEGRYRINPLRYEGDNYNPEGVGPVKGSMSEGFVLNIISQEEKSIEVVLEGFYSGYEMSEPFIIGDGQNFTVCMHINMIGGSGANFNFPYMRMISGTLDQGVLKNIQIATIGLPLKEPNEAGEVVEGRVSMYIESDKISEKL